MHSPLLNSLSPPCPGLRSTLDLKVNISARFKHKLHIVTHLEHLVSPILKSLSTASSPAKQYTHHHIVKQKLTEFITSSYYNKFQSFSSQGHFLQLLHFEQADPSWKSFLFVLPKGIMFFVLCSFINSLPSLSLSLSLSL